METKSKIDWDLPLETQDGRPVELVSLKGRDVVYPVLVFIGTERYPSEFTLEGVFDTRYPDSKYNLRNVKPKPREFVKYINVCQRGYTAAYISREFADKYADQSRIACKRVVFTEGEFDE